MNRGKDKINLSAYRRIPNSKTCPPNGGFTLRQTQGRLIRQV
ncbi:MAG TPA: hypothetical protein PLX42_09840 [Tenuifilaceae bacterium]|nr:hypothetical protein [Tenuifilaceae bacterium]